jgi:crotonobetainyl-CoA:carnitine CoA-transferase CaiB-like acyl-CoA transferase
MIMVFWIKPQDGDYCIVQLQKPWALERPLAALKLLREEARIREMEAKAERGRIHREFKRRKHDEKERREKEELAQSRLRQMGVCCGL